MMSADIGLEGLAAVRVSAGVSGLSVFVVEDEALVLMNLEDMLAELGCRVVGPAVRLSQASQLIDAAAAADVALLDVNVGGDPIFPLAERLRVLGVPVVFATGYGRSGLPAGWDGAQVLQKPYTMGDLERALASAVGAS